MISHNKVYLVKDSNIKIVSDTTRKTVPDTVQHTQNSASQTQFLFAANPIDYNHPTSVSATVDEV